MVEPLKVTEKVVKKGKRAVSKRTKDLKVLQVEYVPIGSVAPNAYNPNRQSEHEYNLLLKSMVDDGFTQPILVQRETREIIDGEHRWRAARDLGFTEIPVVFTTMTAEQMRVATLRHNRARGEENVELTAALLRELESLGSLSWAQKALQLDDVEIQRLMDDIPAPEALAGEDFSQPWAYTHDPNSGNADLVSMSIEAADRLRITEQKIRNAKTEEDRNQARKEQNVYRLNLIFTDEEAELVRMHACSRSEIIIPQCVALIVKFSLLP